MYATESQVSKVAVVASALLGCVMSAVGGLSMASRIFPPGTEKEYPEFMAAGTYAHTVHALSRWVILTLCYMWCCFDTIIQLRLPRLPSHHVTCTVLVHSLTQALTHPHTHVFNQACTGACCVVSLPIGPCLVSPACPRGSAEHSYPRST